MSKSKFHLLSISPSKFISCIFLPEHNTTWLDRTTRKAKSISANKLAFTRYLVPCSCPWQQDGVRIQLVGCQLMEQRSSQPNFTTDMKNSPYLFVKFVNYDLCGQLYGDSVSVYAYFFDVGFTLNPRPMIGVERCYQQVCNIFPIRVPEPSSNKCFIYLKHCFMRKLRKG